jgi:hypothetical protein
MLEEKETYLPEERRVFIFYNLLSEEFDNLIILVKFKCQLQATYRHAKQVKDKEVKNLLSNRLFQIPVEV